MYLFTKDYKTSKNKWKINESILCLFSKLPNSSKKIKTKMQISYICLACVYTVSKDNLDIRPKNSDCYPNTVTI